MSILSIQPPVEKTKNGKGLVISEEDLKRIDLQDRLATLDKRLQRATKSIHQLEKERSSLKFKFRFL